MLKNEFQVRERINQYFDDLYTADEIDQLLDLIRAELHSDYLDRRLKEVWVESLTRNEDPVYTKEQLRKEAHKLLDQLNAGKPKVVSWIKWASVAAVFLVLLVSSLTVYYLSKDSIRNNVLVYKTENVPYGEKKEILLADGSRVVLNSGSVLRYPDSFNDRERKVYLDGEAFFSITQKKDAPFIVGSEKLAVKVLGTEFNMKAYKHDQQSSVSVKNGKVQVETEEMSSKLVAGDHITLDNYSKDYQKRKIELKSISVWIKGGLTFYETPIEDVVKELTRIYNRTIRFEEGQTFNNFINGEHDNKSIESVLKSIEYTSGIKCRKEKDEFVLYK